MAMMRTLAVTLALCAMQFWGVAAAQVYSYDSGQIIPNAQQCSTPYGLVPSFIGPSYAWADTRMGPSGPYIVYGQAYFQLPPIMQRFTSIHECGHVQGAPDEFAANCYALRSGGWSQQDVAFIAAFHRSVPSVGWQYGGSGAAFWQGTVSYCPEFARY